jgi:hypothetical protein
MQQVAELPDGAAYLCPGTTPALAWVINVNIRAADLAGAEAIDLARSFRPFRAKSSMAARVRGVRNRFAVSWFRPSGLATYRKKPIYLLWLWQGEAPPPPSSAKRRP